MIFLMVAVRALLSKSPLAKLLVNSPRQPAESPPHNPMATVGLPYSLLAVAIESNTADRMPATLVSL